jgi:predicted MFS family arabinose efflux permease
MHRVKNDFPKLLAARTFSTLGDIIASIAVVFAVLDIMGGGSLEVGIVLSAELFGLLAFVLVGGVFADRCSPLRSMIASDAVSFVAQSIIAALLATGTMTIAIFSVLLFLKGSASAFFAPASRALLPRIVDSAALQRANASVATSSSIAVVLGPIVAGVVVVSCGAAAAIALDALTFALSAALLSRMGIAGHVVTGRSGPGTGMLLELRDGLREVTGRRWLFGSIVVASTTALLAAGPLLTIMPIVADRAYGGAAGYAWLLSALGVGAVLGGLIARSLQVRRPLLVGHVMLLPFAAAPVALIFSPPIIVVAAAFGLVGVSQIMSGTLWNTALCRAVPPNTLGRVSAWDGLGSFALRPLGQALGGAMAGILGLIPVLWISAAVFVVLPLALLTLADIRAPLTVLEKRLELPGDVLMDAKGSG